MHIIKISENEVINLKVNEPGLCWRVLTEKMNGEKCCNHIIILKKLNFG